MNGINFLSFHMDYGLYQGEMKENYPLEYVFPAHPLSVQGTFGGVK